MLYDKNGIIVATLVGRPWDDRTWAMAVQGASNTLSSVRMEGVASGAFKPPDLDHRRGKFLAFASGVSFGGGQKVYPHGFN